MFNVASRLIAQSVGRFGLCRSGATAAEVALIMPLLSSLIFGTFEYGSVVYTYSAMQFGANRAARSIAVNRMSSAQAVTAIRNSLVGRAKDNATITVSQSTPAEPDTNIVQVRISVAASQATPLPILTRIVPWQLTANVAVKQELPYVD
jgi:Flp pilus assembly protein TadG